MGRIHRSIAFALALLLVLPASSAQIPPLIGADRVEAVQLESPGESLAKLSEVGFYSMVDGGGFGFSGIVLSEEAEMRTIRQIMSNPRIPRLIAGLSAMPREEAERLVYDHLLESVTRYQEMYAPLYADRVEHFRANPLQPGAGMMGVVLQIGNNPDGTPTMLGIRLKVLSLLLIAGNLEFSGTAPAVRRVADAALEQRARLYKDGELPEPARSNLLREVSIYNRIILSTAAVGVMNPPTELKRATREFDPTTFGEIYPTPAGARARVQPPPEQRIRVWHVTSPADDTVDVLYGRAEARRFDAVVLLPSGANARGVQVVFCTTDAPARVDNGRVRDDTGVRRAVTDDRGRFTMPRDREGCLLILHDEAYAMVVVENLTKVESIRLQPWASVTGIRRVGKTPLARTAIGIDTMGNGGYGPSPETRGMVYFKYDTLTDDAGRFAFPRVPGGTFQIGQVRENPEPLSIYSVLAFPRRQIAVVWGQRNELSVGGTGRPVIGKVQAAPGVISDLTRGGSRWITNYVPPLPANYDQMTTEQKQEALQKRNQTPDYQAYERHYRIFQVQVSPDGSFRADDIEPGRYTPTLMAPRGRGRGAPGGAETTPPRVDHEFVMPEVPGGYSEEPLDLGVIVINNP